MAHNPSFSNEAFVAYKMFSEQFTKVIELVWSYLWQNMMYVLFFNAL